MRVGKNGWIYVDLNKIQRALNNISGSEQLESIETMALEIATKARTKRLGLQ
jgi:hypothetical protein